MEIRGLDKMLKKLNKAAMKLEKQFDKSLAELAKDVLADSNSMVPVKTGELYKSSKIDKIGKHQWRIIYHAPYAVYVHEDLTKRHVNGRAKFLQIALTNKTLRLK